MTDSRMWLSWETYQKNICNGLGVLQQRGEFVDMTIAADGHHVKVHQMVMSLVSPYIKELITSAQCPHPIVFLNRVSCQTLQSILEYAYTGEVVISRERYSEFLDACTSLQIKGLENGLTYKTKDDTEDGNNTQVQSTQANEREACGITGSKRRMPDVTADLDYHSTDNVIHSNLQNITLEYSPIHDNNYDDNDDGDENNDVQFVTDDQEKKLVQKNAELRMGSLLKYSMSNQGSIQLVLNRYIYNMRHTRRNNDRMWRCTNYIKQACPAYVFTKDDMVIERGCAHNHPFHDKQIMKRVRNGNMFTAFNTVDSVAAASKKRKWTRKAEHQSSISDCETN